MRTSYKILLISSALYVGGCNSRNVNDNIYSERVIERVLAQKYVEPVKVPEKKEYRYEIIFENDSMSPDKKAIKDVANKIKKLLKKTEAKINIVGHSHGKSLGSVSYLATRRANNVYSYLIKDGISRKKMTRQASWGMYKEDGVIQRGVEIIVNI